MVALALLGAAALGFVGISQMANKGQLGLRTSMDFEEAQISSLMLLTSPSFCTDALKNRVIDLTVGAVDAVPSFQSIVINSKVLVPNPKRNTLKNFKFTVSGVTEVFVVVGTQKVFRVDVKIEADRGPDAIGATQFQSQIPLLLLVETGTIPATIISCYSGVAPCI
jgi:hypothetical protein